MILFPKTAARNPQTKPAALAALVEQSSDPNVLELVARNPATPRGALNRLAGSAHSGVRAAVGGNPAADAEVLEALSKDPDPSVRGAVARNEATPARTLERLARSDAPDIRRDVAGNRATPIAARVLLSKLQGGSEVVANTGWLESVASRISMASGYGRTEERRLLAHDSAEEVRRHIASLSVAETAVLDILVEDPCPGVALVALAARCNDSDELARLSTSCDPLVLCNLMRNSATPPHIRSGLARQLASAADQDTLRKIACDAATPPDVLQQLAGHSDAYLRALVARNRQTPAAAIDLLSEDLSADVRADAAASVALSAKSASRLAIDPEPQVRERLASNHHTPPALLARLARDPKKRVWEVVAGNPSSPPDAFEKILAKLSDARSKLALSAGQWMFRDDEYERGLKLASLESMYQVIARNPSAPPDVLAAIANAELGPSLSNRKGPGSVDYWVNPDHKLREETLRAISENPSTPLKTLRRLSDASWVADRTGTERHSAPMDEGGAYSVTVYSDRLTQEARSSVAAAVRRAISRIEWKEGADASGRLRLARDTATEPGILAELVTDTSREVRQAVAGNPAAPTEALGQLALDPSAEVRAAVAANVRTPSDTLFALMTDREGGVRLAAAGAVRVEGAIYGRKFEPGDPASQRFGAALELLTHDPLPAVRAAVVANPAFWSLCTEEVRGRTAYDADPIVRESLVQAYLEYSSSAGTATHPGLPMGALVHLIDNGDVHLWRALARNRRMPDEALARLLKVDDLQTLLELAQRGSEDVLFTLAESENAAVLSEIAHRKPLSAAISARLARNCCTPGRALAALAKADGADFETLRLVVLNPAAPTRLLVDLAGDADPQRLRAALLSPDPEVAAVLAANPATPIDVQRYLAHSDDPRVRQNLLYNSNTSPEVLALLIE